MPAPDVRMTYNVYRLIYIIGLLRWAGRSAACGNGWAKLRCSYCIFCNNCFALRVAWLEAFVHVANLDLSRRYRPLAASTTFAIPRCVLGTFASARTRGSREE
jgi:hypothetical protein